MTCPTALTGGPLVYFVLGLSLLLAIVLPQATQRIALSPPMVLVAVGMAVGMLPPPTWSASTRGPPRPGHARHRVHRDRLADGRRPGHRADPRPAVVALAGGRGRRSGACSLVTMPLTILGVAVLGWWVAGLAPAVALLLGAVLAPTDPVLASDVQVGEPLTEDVDDPERGGAREPRRGRRHPLLADGRGGPQRRPRLPVRAPGPAAHRRRLHGRRRRHLDRLVRRGQDRRSASPSASRSAGCWAGRRSTPAATTSASPTTASRSWRSPRC